MSEISAAVSDPAHVYGTRSAEPHTSTTVKSEQEHWREEAKSAKTQDASLLLSTRQYDQLPLSGDPRRVKSVTGHDTSDGE